MRTMVVTDKGKKYERISKWIRTIQLCITSRHSLYSYAKTIDSKYATLWGFYYNGRLYGVRQFKDLDDPISWTDVKGYDRKISGYLHTDYGIMLIEHGGPTGGDRERIRLYREVE